MFPVHHKAKLVGVARIELAIAPLSAESFTTKPYPKDWKLAGVKGIVRASVCKADSFNILINSQAFCQLNYTPTMIELFKTQSPRSVTIRRPLVFQTSAATNWATRGKFMNWELRMSKWEWIISQFCILHSHFLIGQVGFEPTMSGTTDLQSACLTNLHTDLWGFIEPHWN